MTVLGGVATVPDLLRLLAVPTFAWAAYRDLQSRRVANLTWVPLLVVGLLTLAWDVWAVLDAPAFARRLFLIRAVVSLGVVAPLGYLFWRIGGFGGADAKALITLAVVFPTTPAYYLPWATLPLASSRLGVLSLTVLTNTVLVGLAFPLALGVRNALAGHRSPTMFVGKRVESASIEREYGRLLDPDGGLSRGGLDLDALRMYLRWRGTSLAALRATPDAHRDPASIDRTHAPGDGVVDPPRDVAAGGGRPVSDGGAGDGPPYPAVRRVVHDDPWGAAAFLASIDGDAYGTTPDDLREGLDALVDRDSVWLTPGLPFIVPMFVGLVVGLVLGDLLFLTLAVLGFA
nr:A24 family peptidase C-terminal domain-containing protein [Halomarina sp. BCD28]